MQPLSRNQCMRIVLSGLGLMLIVVLLLTSALQTDIDMSRYDQGKKHFELVQQKSQMPKYGQCWSDAMMVIQTGCRHLNDVVQSRLALSYLNCFLQIQGKSTYPCSEESELQTCVLHMNDADRASFATFFAHTQDICYFLQAQVWQEQTENTISRLEASSSQVVEQLESSHKLQQDMMGSQNLSLQNQEKLMGQAQNLSDIINKSSRNVHSLFEDLKKSTLEQRQIIGTLFNQLSELQNTIFGEISGFYSLFYYVLAVLVCYLLTSASRTSGARFWLFLVMTGNVVIEQTVLRWIAAQAYWFHTDDVGHELLYYLQRQCRRVCWFLAFFVLVLCAYLYQDINAANNQLLVEIRKQNSDLKRFFTGDQKTYVGHKPDATRHTEHAATESTDSDYTSDNNEYNNSDVDSDKTFILPENHDDSDTDNFQTLQDDVESDADSVSLLRELYDLKRTSGENCSRDVESWLDRSFGNQEVGRTITPVPEGTPYNLRPRKSGQNLNISPAAQVESARSFSRTVHHMQQIAEKNSRLIRAIQQRNPQPSASTSSSYMTPSGSQLQPNVMKVLPYSLDNTDRSSVLTRSNVFTRSSRASPRKF